MSNKSSISVIMLFLYFIKNWVGLTVVNVRTVKYAVQLQENVVQNYIAVG